MEVIDPRTFEPLDMDTVLSSLAKTNRLVVVDEDWERCGFASTLSARVMEQGFDLLDAPVTRVTLPNMPVPGGYMEPYIAPNPEKIEAAIRQVCA
jgi:pyruvate dehydrogenase E1 component beta subunit